MGDEQSKYTEPDLLTGWAKLPRISSPVLFLADILILVFSAISVLGLIGFLCRKWLKPHFPMWLIDLWLLLLVGVEVYLLATVANANAAVSNLAAWTISAYVLWDNAGALLRDTFLGYRIHSGDFVTRNASRWLLATGLCAAQIVLAFSVIFLCFGNNFAPEIKDPWTSLYFSLVTFGTVGYGDFKPATILGMKLVGLEIMFMLSFLSLKLPMAVSACTTEVRTPR